jgi:hypothetical protein
MEELDGERFDTKDEEAEALEDEEAEVGEVVEDEAGEDEEAEEAEEAGREAAAIGGRTGDEEMDPAQRPLSEAGEGEAEGFELAEKELVEHASHGDSGGNPLDDAFTVKEEKAPDEGAFGEPDHERSSEDQP